MWPFGLLVLGFSTTLLVPTSRCLATQTLEKEIAEFWNRLGWKSIAILISEHSPPGTRKLANGLVRNGDGRTVRVVLDEEANLVPRNEDYIQVK